MNSMNYSQPSPQGGQGGGQQMSNGMVRSMGTGMNGFPQGGMQNMGNSTGMNIPMGQPMGPQMGGPQGMMTQQQVSFTALLVTDEDLIYYVDGANTAATIPTIHASPTQDQSDGWQCCVTDIRRFQWQRVTGAGPSVRWQWGTRS